MFGKLQPYRKAIVAAIVAGGAMFLKADADDIITRAEMVEILLAVLGGGGVTWLVPNDPKAPSTRTTRPPDQRHAL